MYLHRLCLQISSWQKNKRNSIVVAIELYNCGEIAIHKGYTLYKMFNSDENDPSTGRGKIYFRVRIIIFNRLCLKISLNLAKKNTRNSIIVASELYNCGEFAIHKGYTLYKMFNSETSR